MPETIPPVPPPTEADLAVDLAAQHEWAAKFGSMVESHTIRAMLSAIRRAVAAEARVRELEGVVEALREEADHADGTIGELADLIDERQAERA